MYMLFILLVPAPTPPRMFQITSVMTTSFSFSWQAPMTLNGVLTGYQLSCQPLLPGIPLPQPLNTTAVTVMLSSLYPGMGYNCSIVARNGAGPSDPVYISNTTQETGMHIHLPYSVLLCFKVFNQSIGATKECILGMFFHTETYSICDQIFQY